MYPKIHNNQHLLPCLHCHPHIYIRMVQHLIERCLIIRMSRDECIKALAQYASIQPLITLTVWRELLKENGEFFQAYSYAISQKSFTGRHFFKPPRFGRRKQWK